MVKGSTIYKQIKEKVAEIEAQHEDLSKQVYDFEQKITALTEERENYYTQLATFYLPELDAQSIQSTLKEVQSEVKRFFGQKQEKRRLTEELMNTTLKNKKSLEEKLDVVTEQLNAKAAERDKLKRDVGKELGADSDYVALDAEAKQTSQVLEQNKKRVEEAKREAEQKLPVYENNMLFMYLVRKGYDGTEIPGLDGWVARIVDYKKQKQNYDFLRSMPELMALEVERRQQEIDSISGKIKEKEKQVADNYGLTKVIGEGQEIGKTRNDIMEQMKQLAFEYTAYSKQRNELDSTKDDYHKQAIQKLKDFLKGDSISDLEKKARETAGSQDDKLVTRIESIGPEIKEYKAKAKELQAQRDALEKKVEELHDLQDKYNRQDYESRRSQFSEGFDINPLLIGYMLGQYTNDHVWDEIESNQHFRQEHSSYDSDSYSSSHYDSGSSFGGGGFSSGGGFGGGGFSSGSGF
ncbi:hypothetical protein HZA33_03885 [Candidatus Pacearchaeota archaeon]|nr:hypothetical protein [Candidatus Pacearchaeota archaeon]